MYRVNIAFNVLIVILKINIKKNEFKINSTKILRYLCNINPSKVLTK